MRKLFSTLLLFTFTLLAIGAPGVALAQDSAPAAAPIQLSLYTAYPSQVIGLDETLSLPLKLHTDTTPQIVKIETQDVPAGWTVTLRGANRIIGSAYVQPNAESAVDLKIEPPTDVASGDYQFSVIAKGADIESVLPIALTVKERVPARLAMSIDLPTKRGKPDSTFTYDVSLANEGDEDLQVSLAGEAPGPVQLTFKLNGQEVEELPLTANSTQRISVEAKPLSDLQAGNYPITLHALSGDIKADLELTAEVVGQPTLSVSAPDGRLSADAYAGRDTPLKVIVQNTGAAPARGIEMSGSQPNGWALDFTPATIDEIAPGQQVEVTANLHPADKAVAGDYMMTVRAKPADAATKSADYRITVRTTTMWGITGVGIIAAAVMVVGLSVMRFGRR